MGKVGKVRADHAKLGHVSLLTQVQRKLSKDFKERKDII